MGSIHPSTDTDRVSTQVAIPNAQQCETGKSIVKNETDLLLDTFIRKPAQHMPCAWPMRVINGFAALLNQREAIELAAVRELERLTRLEIREQLEGAPFHREDSTAQLRIELQAYQLVGYWRWRRSRQDEPPGRDTQSGAGD